MFLALQNSSMLGVLRAQHPHDMADTNPRGLCLPYHVGTVQMAMLGKENVEGLKCSPS